MLFFHCETGGQKPGDRRNVFCYFAGCLRPRCAACPVCQFKAPEPIVPNQTLYFQPPPAPPVENSNPRDAKRNSVTKSLAIAFAHPNSLISRTNRRGLHLRFPVSVLRYTTEPGVAIFHSLFAHPPNHPIFCTLAIPSGFGQQSAFT